MTLRKWSLGMAVAAAALIPLSANADTIMNLPASPNYTPPGSIGIDFSAVTAEIAANIGSGVNGGSCSVAGGNGTCLETTYGAGVLNDVYNNVTNKPLWNHDTVSASNPTGAAIGFVIYGIADASLVSTGGGNENIDNTGATATGSAIHIDFYSMTPANEPCFQAGCGAAELDASAVAPVTSTATSNVFTGATTWADFTLQAGVLPLNVADDGVTNPNITLTQQFNTIGSKGTGDFYASCNTGPGCSDFAPVTEAFLDAIGPGIFLSDPTHALDLTQVFAELNVTPPNGGNIGAGWGLQVKDPVFAVAAVPEPASLGLLGTALAFLGVAIHRRRKGMSA